MHKKVKEYLEIIIIWIFFFILLFSQNLSCVFYDTTGFYCPGCGITRLILSLLQLDFYQAFRYNPLIFIILLISPIYGIYSLVKYKELKELSKKTIIICIIVVVLFTFFRNIPIFNFLAPTEI